MAGKKFKLALIQMLVGSDKAANLKKAVSMIGKAATEGGAQLVVLPEVFNSPYGNQYFEEYSESIPGSTTDALCQAAKEYKVDLIGGSLPEKRDGKLYNTCPIINRNGVLAATYSKIHLFDIDIPGGIRFKESETLSPGSQPLIFSTDYCKIGIGICYDLRFPQLAKLYAAEGCSLLVYPGAFNMTTGPLHWELLARSRSVDNQLYMALASPARNTSATYQAWGHSLVVDPWAKVMPGGGDAIRAAEGIIYADIDPNENDKVRQSIPILKQTRPEIYNCDSGAGVKPIIVQ